MPLDDSDEAESSDVDSDEDAVERESDFSEKVIGDYNRLQEDLEDGSGSELGKSDADYGATIATSILLERKREQHLKKLAHSQHFLCLCCPITDTQISHRKET